MKIIYLGPSGFNINNRRLLDDWLVRPPCKQADIMKDIQQYKPQKICIVDGLYKTIPAPWHKELLLALENNVQLDGVGSLGALRAAELHDFGMNGHGWIYNFIKENEPIDDSVVALLHMDKINNYKPITLAKIEIIYCFISESSITDNQEKNLKIQKLINEIMHINFERLSKKTAALVLSKFDPNVNWNQYLLGNFQSIKRNDTIEYLEKEKKSKSHKNNTPSFTDKTQRTNYIYRQKHLDLDTTYTDDLSDLNYSFQLFASYYYSGMYDIATLETHFILLCRLISGINSDNDYLDIENINWLKRIYTENSWYKDKLGLSILNINSYKKYFPDLLSNFPNKIFELTDEEWLMYHNLYSALEIYGHFKNIDSKTEKLGRATFIGCLVMTSLYETLNNKGSDFLLHQQSPIDLNEKYKAICVLHNAFLELAKSVTLVGFHGGICVQQKLKSDNALIKSYKSSINVLEQKKVFALYSDTFSTERRKNLLDDIEKLNCSRLLEVKPSHSFGTHFYNFHHWILLLEELAND